MALPIGTAFSRLAAAAPDRPALSCAGRTLTRIELEERANRLAHALLAKGVRPGSNVAIVLNNDIPFVVAMVAAWKAGGTPIPVSGRLPAAERDAILDLAAPAAAIGVDVDADRDGEGHPATPPPDTLAVPWKILPSGGSTGRPKLIASVAEGRVEPGQGFGLLTRMTPEGTSLVTGPMTHNGPFLAMISSLLLGCHAVLMRRFDAAETLRLAEEYRADWIYAVPTMMHRIWRLPEAERDRSRLDSVKVVFHLGAPIAPWLKRAWIDWLGPDRIWELYAGTEAQAVTVVGGREWLAHEGSVGKVFAGDMKILDAEGRELPPGEVGEVWMRSTEGPTYAYIGATAREQDGWESLGDMGYMDADGYLYLSDRQTDMILVGGSNVYPAEIEGALLEHPAIRTCAVIGLPDDDLGQAPHAIVQTRAEVTDDQLLTHLRDRLAAYKLPKTFERTDEPLRDEAGKVRRSRLRAARLPGAAAT
ncbi:MAG: AMP-binding protein [Streptosporangiales bacterium]|nr:AMP-binding protein [Streptosporangiales bacterium]